MMKFILIAFPICLFCLNQAFAKAKPTLNKKSQRTTEAHFTGATVNGQYAHSPEAMVSVEKEKKLISVVKPRENFNFQIKKSQEDYK